MSAGDVVRPILMAGSRLGFVGFGHTLLFNRRAFGFTEPVFDENDRKKQTVRTVIGLGGGSIATAVVAGLMGLGNGPGQILTVTGGLIMMIFELNRIQTTELPLEF